VRVGVAGIEGDGAFVGAHRVGSASEVFEGDPEVEGRGLVVGIDLQRCAVVPFGGGRRAFLVQQTAEVYVRLDVVRIGGDGPLVGVLGLLDGRHLQLASELVPVVGVELVRALARVGGVAMNERRRLRREVGDGEVEE
jgi:hypothetical protein